VTCKFKKSTTLSEEVTTFAPNDYDNVLCIEFV